MKCYVCGTLSAIEILNSGPIKIWNDACDKFSIQGKYRRKILQCCECGHVYQPITRAVEKQLEKLYESEEAQGVSSMGIGNWGVERAERLFFSRIKYRSLQSILEIGCGDGYLLKKLYEKGGRELFGLEPSRNGQSFGKIKIINKFINNNLNLNKKFTFIYSIAVFEHIKNINSVFSFVKRHLSPDGIFYFFVPNSEALLENNDPNLFTHQHVHYFTEASIRRLLKIHGFRVKIFEKDLEGFYVTSEINEFDNFIDLKDKINLYLNYQNNLDRKIANLKKLDNENVIFHGASNSLNNLLSIGLKKFILVDNDRNKIGKQYFGKVVNNLEKIKFNSIDFVVIMPHAYFSDIENQYRVLGYNKKIISINEL